MKFSIITPTYKRATELRRAVDSVCNQTLTNWEMIIVNDSPDDTSYAQFESAELDHRVKYFKNNKNMGVNFSRNFALNNISIDSTHVILLDDDDWLSIDTLSHFENLQNKHRDCKWLVSDRVTDTGKSLTHAPKNNSLYSYAYDYLLLKNFRGDATHCIDKNEITNIRFSTSIKQGEEWTFFYELGLRNKFLYNSFGATISAGYDAQGGLNFRKRSKGERAKTLLKLLKEGYKRELFYYPSFGAYLLARFILLIVM
jgi:glycosyltransferase involved in cell wall biosynthesis